MFTSDRRRRRGKEGGKENENNWERGVEGERSRLGIKEGVRARGGGVGVWVSQGQSDGGLGRKRDEERVKEKRPRLGL